MNLHRRAHAAVRGVVILCYLTGTLIVGGLLAILIVCHTFTPLSYLPIGFLTLFGLSPCVVVV